MTKGKGSDFKPVGGKECLAERWKGWYRKQGMTGGARGEGPKKRGHCSDVTMMHYWVKNYELRDKTGGSDESPS